MAKKVKKKLNIKGLFVILLSLYLLIMVVYYVVTLPINSIIIEGNVLTSDLEIIEAAGISDYPAIFKITSYKMKKNILDLDYVSDVKVKKSLLGNITINVVEERILFYNTLNSTYVLTNGDERGIDKDIEGIPILVNYTPSEVYEGLIKGLNIIDTSILKLISEIEYDPEQSYDEATNEYITTDDSRFLLRMNDGNFVYINIENIEKLNNYIKAFATLEEGELGVFFFDSSSKNNIHKTFESIEQEKQAAENPVEEEQSQ